MSKIEDFKEFIRNKPELVEYIKNKGYELKYNYNKGLDYLKVIDKIIGDEKNEESCEN